MKRSLAGFVAECGRISRAAQGVREGAHILGTWTISVSFSGCKIRWCFGVFADWLRSGNQFLESPSLMPRIWTLFSNSLYIPSGPCMSSLMDTGLPPSISYVAPGQCSSTARV